MLKNLDTKFDAYVSTFYMLTKSFHRKPTFYVSCVKKTKFSLKKWHCMRHFFVFFTQATKNVGFR
jgi:hypothetical protein